jgi:hypothetical protein
MYSGLVGDWRSGLDTSSRHVRLAFCGEANRISRVIKLNAAFLFELVEQARRLFSRTDTVEHFQDQNVIKLCQHSKNLSLCAVIADHEAVFEQESWMRNMEVRVTIVMNGDLLNGCSRLVRLKFSQV